MEVPADARIAVLAAAAEVLDPAAGAAQDQFSVDTVLRDRVAAAPVVPEQHRVVRYQFLVVSYILTI